MTQSQAQFDRFKNQVSKVQLPHWDEFPDMELYADQVIGLVNDRLRPLAVTPLTKAMINNYVKKGIITAPVKKKYSQNQLAAVTVISLLKGSFALPTIRAAIDQATVNNYPKAAYDRFVDLFNAALKEEAAPKTILNPAIDELLKQAVDTTIGRLKTMALLMVLQEQLPPTKIKEGPKK